jgi:hypothetical protein
LGQYEYQKVWKNTSYTCLSQNCYLCSSSEQFMLGYKEVLDAYQVKYSYVVREEKEHVKICGRDAISHGDQHRITVQSNNDLNKFLSLIYYPGHKLSMPRKHKIALQIIETTQNYLNRDRSFSSSRKENISKSLLVNAARGEQVSISKLKDNDIREIRLLSETMKVADIARLYSVGWNTIDRVIRRQTWKHIP